MADKECPQCTGEVKNLSSTYCSMSCAAKFRSDKRIQGWLLGVVEGNSPSGMLRPIVRRWVLDRDGNKCIQCGWCEIHPVLGYPPLEVNHIDGNGANSRPENLETLCPNCHALTPNYRALNKNSNRTWRRHGDSAVPLTSRAPILPDAFCGVCGKKLISKRSKFCADHVDNTKIDWPNAQKVLEMLDGKTFVAVAKQLGVTDNAVRRFLLRSGVEVPDRHRYRKIDVSKPRKKREPKPLVHGGSTAYNKGCRCVECREFKRLKNARFR